MHSAEANEQVASNERTQREPHDELLILRNAIERVDDALVDLLAERQALVLRVAERKRAAGMAVADPAREAGVVRRAAERARSTGLESDAVRELFRRMIALSRELQLGK